MLESENKASGKSPGAVIAHLTVHSHQPRNIPTSGLAPISACSKSQADHADHPLGQLLCPQLRIPGFPSLQNQTGYKIPSHITTLASNRKKDRMGCTASFPAVEDTLLTGVKMSSANCWPPYLPVGIDQYLLSVLLPILPYLVQIRF